MPAGGRGQQARSRRRPPIDRLVSSRCEKRVRDTSHHAIRIPPCWRPCGAARPKVKTQVLALGFLRHPHPHRGGVRAGFGLKHMF